MYVAFETPEGIDPTTAYPRFCDVDVWKVVEEVTDTITRKGSFVLGLVRSDIDGSIHICDTHGNAWVVEYVQPIAR